MSRGVICWILLVATPLSLTAADTGMAMLYSKGEVLRNSAAVSSSSAVFPGDLIETKADSQATLSVLGSNVIILPGSLVEFQGKSILLEHGGVSVATSQAMIVRVKCMDMVPVSTALTQFEVRDVSGTIEVAARKNDIRLDSQPSSTPAKQADSSKPGNVLHEGEQAKRDESDGCKSEKASPGSGGLLSSNWVRYGGVAAVGGILVGILAGSGNPPSPWKP